MTQLKAPRKTGHWLRDDVPHSGWRCEGITDPEDIFTRIVTTCEMCEVTGIAHQHVMTHETLPGVELMCGYVCAAFMTGNAEARSACEKSCTNGGGTIAKNARRLKSCAARGGAEKISQANTSGRSIKAKAVAVATTNSCSSSK